MASLRDDAKYGVFGPDCNIETVRDGRGGIFTWVPKESIKEIDLIYITPGLGKEDVKNDFTEYFLMIDGSGVMVFNTPDNREEVHHMSRGDCVYCTPEIIHSFHAITPAVALILRSKAIEENNFAGEGKFGLLNPSCSMETVIKKREGIFRWNPKEPIMEFNLLYFTPGASRGDHFHPHFTEYFLIVDGSGKMVYKDPQNPQNKEVVYHMSRGNLAYTTPGIAHAFHAINPLIAVAMLSKPWDECDPPIVRCDVSRHLEEK